MSARTTNSVLRLNLAVLILLASPGFLFAQEGKEVLKKDDKRLVYTLFDQIMELGAEAKKSVQEKQKGDSSVLYNPERKMQFFGWHASWMGETYLDYQFESLTSIAYHASSMSLESDGRVYFDEGDWYSATANTLIQMADEDSCNALVTFRCDDATTIAAMLSNEQYIHDCVKFISDLVTSRPNVEGLAISFEDMPYGYSEQFSAFVMLMKKQLNVFNKALVLAIPPAMGSKKYNLAELNKHVDQFVMLGYNYFYKGSHKAGPVSPLLRSKKWGDLNIQQSVNEYLSYGVPREKLIIAFPYYGIRWEIRKTSNGNVQYKFAGNPPINEIWEIPESMLAEYDDKAATAYFNYEADGKSYIVYFDNVKALKQKYDWVQNKRLAGVGMWTLGYDDGDNRLWKLISDNYSVLKNPGFKKIINDSIPAFQPPLTEAAAKADIRKILKQSEVQIVLGCTVLLFVALGAVLGLTSSSIFERILIYEFRTYLKVLGIFLGLMLLLFFIAGFVFHTEAYLKSHHLHHELVSSESVQAPIRQLTFLGFLIITALSYKSFLQLNKDVP